jgi:hypothetical protein
MTKEQLRMQMLAGIITEGQYKEKIGLIENETNVSPEQAVNKAIAFAPKLEKSSEIDALAQKIAKDPNLMSQMEKALQNGGITLNEEKNNLDIQDMKTLALNLSKKINEGISNDPEKDDTSAGLGMAAAFGGGVLGASFSSAIASAIPAVTSIFGGAGLVGALAGVALFIVARKVYLKLNPDK